MCKIVSKYLLAEKDDCLQKKNTYYTPYMKKCTMTVHEHAITCKIVTTR